MDKIEMLLVRACKSLNSQKRLISVYRRFYWNGYDENFNVKVPLTSILVSIIDKYCPLKAKDMIDGLAPNSIFTWSKEETKNPFGHPVEYYEQCSRVLVSHIRHSEVEKFEGCIWPSRYRKLNQSTKEVV